MILDNSFFNIDASELAKALLGKVICKATDGALRKARIIVTEAYYKDQKASHASLGYTYKRRALFMPPGTLYFYHSRGGDSMNISAKGDGDAVLIKSCIAHLDNNDEIIKEMVNDNPIIDKRTGEQRERAKEFLCSGQTLLCKSLRLKITDWDAKNFQPEVFYLEDIGYLPVQIIVSKRRGITIGRDEDLPLRFFDNEFRKYITK